MFKFHPKWKLFLLSVLQIDFQLQEAHAVSAPQDLIPCFVCQACEYAGSYSNLFL